MTNEQMKAGRFLKWAKAKKRMAWVQEMLKMGKTVQVTTHLKATRYTKKHADMFKATKSGFYVQSGKSWLCLDFSNISAY